jgi:hypothetical protein
MSARRQQKSNVHLALERLADSVENRKIGASEERDQQAFAGGADHLDDGVAALLDGQNDAFGRRAGCRFRW